MVNKIILAILFILGHFLFSNSNIEDDATFFSPVMGKILYKGEPVIGAKVVRRYSGTGANDYITEQVTTNGHGEYSFEQGTLKLGIMRFLPHEAVISQEITLTYLGVEYPLWYMVKRNYDFLGELKTFDDDPILSDSMMKGYKGGFISLRVDLNEVKNIDGEFQRVDDYIMILSVQDFNFPYEEAIRRYSNEILFREEEFIAPIVEWFQDNKDFFKILNDQQDGWLDIEAEELEPYLGAIVTGVDSVNFSDHIDLWYFTEDYYKETKRVSIGGEIILNVVTPEKDKKRARIWLHDSIFYLSDSSVRFEPTSDRFMINSSNIDPDSP